MSQELEEFIISCLSFALTLMLPSEKEEAR